VGLFILLILGSISVFADASYASAKVDLTDTEVIAKVDYNQFAEDGQKTIIVTTNSFTLKNNNAEEVKVKLEVSGLPTKYTAESKELTILGNSTISTTLALNITHDKGTGSVNIGNVVVKGLSGVQLDSVALTQKTKSMLEMSNLQVEYVGEDGNKESDSFDWDETDLKLQENVKPYTKVSMEFKVKNLMDKDYDVDLSNIKITIEADDNDFFEDSFEEEFDLDDLAASENVEQTIEFMINEDASAGDYKLDITLEGEDDKGVEYVIEMQLELTLKKEKDDLRITKFVTVPESVTLCEKSFTFKIEIKNFGSQDQKFAALSMVNEELKFNENLQNIYIEKSGDEDTWTKDFVYTFPKTMKKGTYAFDIKAYVDKDEVISEEKFNLIVGECKKVLPPVVEEETPVAKEETDAQAEVITSKLDLNEDEKESSEGKTVTQTVPTTSKTAAAKTASTGTATALTSAMIINTVEDTYSREDFLVGIMLAALVIVLALIIIFFMVLLKN